MEIRNKIILGSTQRILVISFLVILGIPKPEIYHIPGIEMGDIDTLQIS